MAVPAFDKETRWLYDSFQAALEAYLPYLKRMTVSLTADGLRMALEASAEEIADKLGISANTVKRHLQNIMEKTGFESRLDLAMNAKSLGLVVSDENRTKPNQSITDH